MGEVLAGVAVVLDQDQADRGRRVGAAGAGGVEVGRGDLRHRLVEQAVGGVEAGQQVGGVDPLGPELGVAVAAAGGVAGDPEDLGLRAEGVDDEDGDRSFAFAMKIPVGREVLQEYLRKLFENDQLKLVARARKTDSVELNSGEDFLGVISADDAKGSSYTLQIAILDFDLEDDGE